MKTNMLVSWVAFAVVSIGCGDTATTGTDGEETDGGQQTAPTYSVGGTVTGLTGSGLVLQNNDVDDLALSSDGSFVFATKLESGMSFAVAVKTQPTSPAQTCTVSGGTGTVASGNVTSVVINCTDTHTVGGTVTGLTGSGLVLLNGGGDATPINANGTFAFGTPVAVGDTYAVTVQTQPQGPSQTCTVTSGTGTMGTAPVTDVTVACVTNTFTVGGTLAGLTGTGLVLQNGGADDLTLDADGAFTFATALEDGSVFDVTVLTQPTGPAAQTCTVSGGAGMLAGGNITSILVNCATHTHAVGGTVTGLLGAGLTLQNNGGDDLPLTSDGTFAFPTPIEELEAYDVTVLTQPTNPWQTCLVTNGSGNIADAPVTDVMVTCTTNSYLVGGTLTGLTTGASVVLQNAGGDDLTLTADGSFAFTTPVPSGETYAVTVLTQPGGPVSQTCTAANESGMVMGTDVTTVTVTCTTHSYTVGGTITGLGSAGTVMLQNNLGDDLALSADGAFTFTTAIDSGAGYDVSVLSTPAGMSCQVFRGRGTVGGGPVTDVFVNCFMGCWPGDDFEDGDYLGWRETGGNYTRTVEAASAANGTTLGLTLQGAGGLMEGLRYRFPPSNPSKVSVWMQANDASSSGGSYFVLGDANTGSNGGIIYLFASNPPPSNGARWRIYADASHDRLFSPVVANEWVHFEFDINWVSKTVDVTANGTLLVTDFPFRSADSIDVSEVHFFNLASTTTRYDELQFVCP